MASNSGGAEADTYAVRKVQDGVMETIFSALPTDSTDRNKEQARRRKFKDKLLAEHHGELVIDSSYVTSDGKPMQTYTDTLMVTDKLDWWQEKIEETFGEDYLQGRQPLSAGHKIIFKNTDGENFLSFLFYPGKNKLMVQGGHDELNTWISKYVELCKQITNTPGDSSEPASHDHDTGAMENLPNLTESESNPGTEMENDVTENLLTADPFSSYVPSCP